MIPLALIWFPKAACQYSAGRFAVLVRKDLQRPEGHPSLFNDRRFAIS